MGRHVNTEEIPVTVISAATQGKPDAISYVLRHYRKYIRKLATRTLKDEYGNEYLFVDEDMANRLQSKLIFSIISDFSILPA